MEATVKMSLKDYEYLNRTIEEHKLKIDKLTELLKKNPNNFGEGIDKLDHHILAKIVHDKIIESGIKLDIELEDFIETGNYRVFIDRRENPLDPTFPSLKPNQFRI